jgi:DNA-directed RNA polymerase specialized sigma24 family protein
VELSVEEFEQLKRIANVAAMRVLTRSGGHDVDDAIGAAMEALTRAGDGVRCPEAFVTVVARRRAMDHRDDHERRRVGQASVPEPGGEHERAFVVDPWDGVHAQMDEQGLVGAVRAAAEALPPDLRAVIEVSVLREPPLGGREAAAELGIAYGTYRNRRSQALRLLPNLVLDALGTPDELGFGGRSW